MVVSQRAGSGSLSGHETLDRCGAHDPLCLQAIVLSTEQSEV